MGKYKQYNEEFKRDVLAMVAEGKRSVAEIERDLGLTTGNRGKRLYSITDKYTFDQVDGDHNPRQSTFGYFIQIRYNMAQGYP